MGIVALKTQER